MKQRAALALGWACQLALSSACNPPAHEAPGPAKARGDAGLARPATPDAGSLPRSVRPAHAAPRVKACSPGLTGLREGAELPQGPIVLAQGEDVLLDFAAGARVHLRGPCLAESAVTDVDALLVRRCALSIDLVPAAPTPDSGFSLTTPSVALSLVRGGRLAVRVFESGATTALTVSGSVSLRAAGSRFVEGQDALAPGQRLDLALDGKLTRAAADAPTLAQAEQHAVALRETKPDRRAPMLLDQLLGTCSDELRAELARAHALTLAHRAALTAEGATAGAAKSDALMALQAELASQAAVLARARLRLVVALGQRDASRLSVGKVSEDALSVEARGLLRPSP